MLLCPPHIHNNGEQWASGFFFEPTNEGKFNTLLVKTQAAAKIEAAYPRRRRGGGDD